jgi:glycosyltransferase involved in cell wall biosynthesis
MGYLNLALMALRPLLPRETRFIVREANAVAATAGAFPRLISAQLLYRSLYPRADRIVSPTQIIADEIASLAPRAADRIVVIRNPIDLDQLRARATPSKRHPGPGLRLASAGRLTHQKGFDRLLALLPGLPPSTHVTILGEGPERERLEAQARALGVENQLTLTGFSTDAPAWIGGADAFLLPSRWEGLPNVVLESLAVGTPAIVSNEAAVSEVASAAASGAVTIRPMGQAFLDAISALTPASQGSQPLRPSLLPPSYFREAVVKDWSRLLESVTSGSTSINQ